MRCQKQLMLAFKGGEIKPHLLFVMYIHYVFSPSKRTLGYVFMLFQGVSFLFFLFFFLEKVRNFFANFLKVSFRGEIFICLFFLLYFSLPRYVRL